VTANVLEDLQAKSGLESDLAKIYSSNVGPIVHKWHHYIPIYEKYFNKYKGKKVRFLELGVSRGGSLRMWREYFGPDAIIFGIDIDPECEKIVGVDAEIRIGSQDDPIFLHSVLEEMGGIDIVLDDGSHQMKHINASLKHLFPKLEDGGVYFIEDLHTAYWRGYQGGYHSRNNFFRTVTRLINDMHSWYHPYRKKLPLVSDGLVGIHVHDSIVVLDKGKVHPPTHSQIG
jgi:hypothetical protein